MLSGTMTSRIWSFGDCSFDERRLELVVAGEIVAVEPRPLELLCHLLHHAGALVTKDQLLEAVWPGRVTSEAVLTKTVAKLRQALRDEDQALIRTVYGQGYRLIAPVSVKTAIVDPPGASAPASAPARQSHPPSRPNWLLQETLGTTGHSEVALARHDKTGQWRVFKFARNAAGLRGLKREITLYRVLRQTPGIGEHLLEILDWNLTEAPCFIEYPYVAGGNLAQWLQRQREAGRPCSLQQRIELLAQTATALAAAHDAGVLHKDVKPGNVLVDTDSAGQPLVRLADFGSGDFIDLERLARLEITRLGFTQTLADADNTSGTPLYLSPEVLAGQAPSTRSDIYALGVVLYQTVVGDFRQPLAPGWERQVDDPLLCEDIAACADLDPNRRLPDARALAQRLRSLEERREARARPQADKPSSTNDSLSTHSHARRKWLLAGGAIAGAAMISGGLIWRNNRPAASNDVIRIAVLPFNDMSVGGIEGALADGLASDVIGRFERVARVHVVARSSAFKLRTSGSDLAKLLPDIKSRLDAEYAMFGDVYRNRGRVRLTARVVSIANGEILWQDSVEQTADNIGALPALVARGALEALNVAVTLAPPNGPSEAYELYLLGQHAFEARTTEAIRKARDYYQRAIDLDAGYARAYAGLAKTWLAEADYGFGLSWREAAARAQPLLDKALTLQVDLLEALIVQGVLFVQMTQFEQARSHLARAVELYPNSAQAHFTLGLSYDFDTVIKKAVEHYAYTLQLDPLNVLVDRRLGMSLMWAGQYETAVKHFKRTAELLPNGASGFWGLGSLGYARGRYDDAVRSYREALGTDSRHPGLWNELAWLYMDLGMPRDAQAALDNQRQLVKSPAEALLDGARLLLLRNEPDSLAQYLADNALLTNAEPGIAVEAMVLASIAGQPVDLAAVDRNVQQMRGDPVRWVGCYDLFLGHCTWLEMATLYVLADRPDRAAPLLAETQAFIERIDANGNVYHTIPYFEARIAALRNQSDLAVKRLRAAVDAGWRRGWWLRWDPAFRTLRSDARLTALLQRTDSDMVTQRERLSDSGHTSGA